MYLKTLGSNKSIIHDQYVQIHYQILLNDIYMILSLFT